MDTNYRRNQQVPEELAKYNPDRGCGAAGVSYIYMRLICRGEPLNLTDRGAELVVNSVSYSTGHVSTVLVRTGYIHHHHPDRLICHLDPRLTKSSDSKIWRCISMLTFFTRFL